MDAQGERLAPVPSGAGAVVLTGEGAAAPGLVAGRAAGAAAAPECRPPSYDEWYVGLGASAQDSSAFELVNPDPGAAVVEIVLYGPSGEIEEPALRGIRVPGNEVKVLDLSEIAPRRVRLAAHLTVTRGRISAAVRHTYDPLGLRVESAAPVVAGVEVLEGDLGRVGPVTAEEDTSVTVVPEGPKRLLLGAAIRPGVIRVTATDADGKVLMDEERVEISSDRAASLALPDAAVAVTVEPRNTPIAGTVLLTGTARAPVFGQVRLRPAEVYAQVPAVVPE